MAFFESSKRKAFAQKVIATLVQGGRAGPWTYDAEKFSVSGGGSWFGLERPYAEYQAAGDAALERFRQALQPIPKERGALLACLRPMLRDRAWLEEYAIEHRRSFGQALAQPPPHGLVSEHHVVSLVAWQTAALTTVTEPMLVEAGISHDEAFAAAGANLRALAPGFRELRRGLWVSVLEDDFDASRLLLRAARDLAVRGEPVALAANRNALFITGDRDDENLEAMIAVAGKELTEARALAPLLLRWEGEWAPWVPEPSSKTYVTFKRWALKATLDRYNRQKKALEELEKELGDDVEAHPLQSYFYGSMMATGDGPDAKTLCFWFPTPTLLPKCDELCLRAEADGPIVTVPWGRALEVFPGMLEKIDAYPERWKAERFPTPQQLAAAQ